MLVLLSLSPSPNGKWPHAHAFNGLLKLIESLPREKEREFTNVKKERESWGERERERKERENSRMAREREREIILFSVTRSELMKLKEIERICVSGFSPAMPT